MKLRHNCIYCLLLQFQKVVPVYIKLGSDMMVYIQSIQITRNFFKSGVTCKQTVEAGQCFKEDKTQVWIFIAVGNGIKMVLVI